MELSNWFQATIPKVIPVTGLSLRQGFWSVTTRPHPTSGISIVVDAGETGQPPHCISMAFKFGADPCDWAQVTAVIIPCRSH